MKIHEIKFTNFRAFESFQMDFDPRATVIVGRNGTGKSTILDGIAIAFAPWVVAFGGPHEARGIKGTDGRLATMEHAGLVATEPVFPVLIEAVANEPESGTVEWLRELTHADRFSLRSENQQGHQLWDVAFRFANKADHDEQVIFPLIAHYRTRRLWVSGTFAKREQKAKTEDAIKSRSWGYQNALAAGADRKDLEQWMAWREADRVQRLAQAIDEGKDTRDVKSPQMEAVAIAAKTCLEGAKRFYYSANHRELRIDFDKGPSIPFKSLSDGQKNVIAVAADIAWRAAQLNPHLGANIALETPGIVLIDELDLHLHPAWQMRVLDDLMRAFPQIQFIVTTHSPQVMSAAPPNSVRLLDTAHVVHRVDRLRGRDTNSILEDILGVPSRPPQWKEKLDKLARFIEDGDLDQAEALLAELEKDDFYSDDAAIVGARWEIAMARGAHAKD